MVICGPASSKNFDMKPLFENRCDFWRIRKLVALWDRDLEAARCKRENFFWYLRSMAQSAIVLKGKAHGSDGDENRARTFMNNPKIFNLASARARARARADRRSRAARGSSAPAFGQGRAVRHVAARRFCLFVSFSEFERWGGCCVVFCISGRVEFGRSFQTTICLSSELQGSARSRYFKVWYF